MKILLVSPAVQMSIADVSRGYLSALVRAGHEVYEYSLRARYDYHAKAIPPEVQRDPSIISRQASETILNEAMYHQADLVLIISGLNVHPIALWLLGRVGIRTAVIFTESPYDDEQQAQWADLSHVGGNVDLTVFTHDRYSADKYGWNFLAPAFDPAFHHPADPDPHGDCDVFMVATGWQDRQQFLEAVNWDGIDLRLFGVWPGLNDKPESPLHRFYHPAMVTNDFIAGMYSAAKICINLHRASNVAFTPNPRVYEAAACGAFQISDPRFDMTSTFGRTIPTFVNPQSCEQLIRYYLAHPDERKNLAKRAMERVQPHTFDNRVIDLVDALNIAPTPSLAQSVTA